MIYVLRVYPMGFFFNGLALKYIYIKQKPNLKMFGFRADFQWVSGLSHFHLLVGL